MIDKYSVRTIFSATLLLNLCGSIASAQTTTAEFLEWDRASQTAFFQSSITMAGYIAAQIEPDTAQCIDEWYLASRALQEQRHIEMRQRMPEFGDYPPSAVVIAFLREACGAFMP